MQSPQHPDHDTFRQQLPQVTQPGFPGAGRYAPSPSGELHFGNLRTAVIAWAAARSTGRKFFLRIEDIDTQRSRVDEVTKQIEDLTRLGLDFDEPVVTQSDRFGVYQEAIDYLSARGWVYPCFCSRKDIQQAASAPHGLPGMYPGTCRDLSDEEREEKRAQFEREGRTPALRCRTSDLAQATSHDKATPHATISDVLHGSYSELVDDIIVRRGGATADYAYNLAVVIDDHYMGVDQVVRGDDLLSSAPRQKVIAEALGFTAPSFIHVPLVVNDKGQRLAKRDGAVTFRQLEQSLGLEATRQLVCSSLGFGDCATVEDVAERFTLMALSRESYVFMPPIVH